MNSKIGIVVTLKQELLVLKHLLGLEFAGQHRGFSYYSKGPWVAVVSGTYFDHGYRATKGLVEVYQPKVLLSVGLSAALSDKLKVGDVVFAEGVLYRGQWTASSFTKLYEELESSGDVIGPRLVASPVLSLDFPTLEAQDRLEMYQQSKAKVVDGETAAVSWVASRKSLPWAALRVVAVPQDKPWWLPVNWSFHPLDLLQFGINLLNAPTKIRQTGEQFRDASQALLELQNQLPGWLALVTAQWLQLDVEELSGSTSKK